MEPVGKSILHFSIYAEFCPAGKGEAQPYHMTVSTDFKTKIIIIAGYRGKGN
jgi:hypothetical protein